MACDFANLRNKVKKWRMNKEEELFTQAIILIDLRIIRSLAFVASSRINFDKKKPYMYVEFMT